MAKEGGPQKFDPNTEAFQMRAEWKKAEMGRKQWHERWSWLLDERQKALDEAQAICQAAASALPRVVQAKVQTKSLKPVPATSFRFVGWLSARSETAFQVKRQFTLPDEPDSYLRQRARKRDRQASISLPSIAPSRGPDCQLEIYTPWRIKVPIKAPDAWELPNYVPAASKRE